MNLVKNIYINNIAFMIPQNFISTRFLCKMFFVIPFNETVTIMWPEGGRQQHD